MTGLDLKIARVRAGLRQYHVAAAVGMSQSVLSQIENGQRVVSQERLDQIARAIRRLGGAAPSEEATDAA
jgi:transcriptional regulator with XRE-family HTH domain